MNTIIFYGANWCPDCQRAKDYLKNNNIAFDFVDVDLDKEATQKVENINSGKRIIPTLLINNTSYTNPSNIVLSSVLGINNQGVVKLFGADWCPDCRRAKEYLQNNKINFQFIDIDTNEWAVEKVEEINNGKRIIPTVLINEKPFTNPDNAILKKELKIGDVESSKVYDVIIVGAGAAGLTTSIYTQRDRFSSLILDKKNVGGNAYLTKKVENYPGFTEISGPELMDKMASQAKVYGAEILTGVEVKNIAKKGLLFDVESNMGTYQSKSIVLTVGSTYRKLNIPNEEELIGSGIHFCATCDGAFYRDKEVIVIGGGNSALEEGIFLASFCKKVKIINRKKTFKASKTYIEKLPEISNIEVYTNKTSIEFTKTPKGNFEGLRVQDNETKETETITANGAFIFVGLIPNTKDFESLIELNNQNFIKTTGMGETSIEGIFAAGDCREGAIAQIAAATGEGVLASYGVKNYLK